MREGGGGDDQIVYTLCTGLGITAVELVDASMWPEEISCIEEVKEVNTKRGNCT